MFVDSVVPFINVQDKWGRVTNAEIFPMENGGLRLEAYGGAAESSTLRLVAYTKHGILTDKPILGDAPTKPKKPELSWDILDGGIAVRVSTQNLRSSDFYLRIYNGDKLLGSLLPTEMVSMREYLFFIPANKDYQHISLLELTTDPDREVIGQMQKIVNFHLIGHKPIEISSPDNKFIVTTEQNTTYRMNFISLEEQESGALPIHMSSTIYTVKPDYFLTAKNFDVVLKIDSTAKWQDRTGLCWLNEEDNQWIWLEDNTIESLIIQSKSQGGGKFAAIIDRRKPKIKNLNVRRGTMLRRSQPEIKFEIVDSLSGIRDDRDISIHIDDQWLIPEYDPETGVCISKPWVPLTEGNHELKIELNDRAGNISRQIVKFKVQTSQQK